MVAVVTLYGEEKTRALKESGGETWSTSRLFILQKELQVRFRELVNQIAGKLLTSPDNLGRTSVPTKVPDQTSS